MVHPNTHLDAETLRNAYLEALKSIADLQNKPTFRSHWLPYIIHLALSVAFGLVLAFLGSLFMQLDNISLVIVFAAGMLVHEISGGFCSVSQDLGVIERRILMLSFTTAHFPQDEPAKQHE